MIAGDLLRIFGEVADEHAREHSPEAPPRVLPIITDEVSFRGALLTELSLALGGVVLDTGGDDLARAVAGRDQASLRGDVQTMLSYRDARGLDNSVSLEFANGLVDAQLLINGERSAASSTGQQQVLALVRGLFSTPLDEAELVVIRYSETMLDPDAARAVWRLLLGLSARNGLRLGGVRTVVPLVHVAEFNVARHVGPHGGARFVRTMGVSARRKPSGFTRQLAERLVTPRTPPLVMFLGAGFSISSSLPSGNALRDSAIRRLVGLPDPDDGRTPADLAHAFVSWEADLPADVRGRASEQDHRPALEKARDLTLEQVSRVDARYSGTTIPPAVDEFFELHRARLESPEALGDSVLLMRAIARRCPRLVLVTVNFDELLEAEDPTLFDRAVTDAEFEELTPKLQGLVAGGCHPTGKVPLLKLHGTITDRATCVADEETVRIGISRQKRNALLALMPPTAGNQLRQVGEGERTRWVYIGASMRDADLNPTVLQTSDFNLGIDEWWVAPTLEPTVQQFYRACERRWSHTSTLEDRVVTDVADSFMRALNEAWR